ncbi:intermembrane transport protein PqiB [Catenovulum sediminis]|uniref:Intermembrane transport protein PqiB n=1 Tax=Catenovulum sediminis TaxID=1740262 RepID=A0ABV1RH50_9ALTE|nr:intermembrane transport protein PqiB [Catenovulum sediminis]
MQTPTIKKRTKLSSVWIIPLFAMLVSIWFVTQHYLNRGTEIEIRFQSAEGIEAGKTLIKTLNVEVGVVTKVEINEDLLTVRVLARIKPEATNLLRQDSQFWVVKPRIGSKGVSGLTTLLSGAYIELEPGNDYPGKTSFVGLENPPLNRTNKDGLNIYLVSDASNSLNAGDPVLFKGFEVGQVTQIEILNSKKLKTNIFIESPYDRMVTSNSRFYNTSGVSFRLNAQGIDVFSDSIESTLTGGISFDLPATLSPGKAVTDGTEFKLYENKMAIEAHPYQYSVDYLLLFERSIRGLNIGEYVEYRGVRVGTVVDISFDYLPENQFDSANAPKVPVLIRLDPGRILGEDSPAAVEKLTKILNRHVKNGLRAALKTGSLVTGQSYIQLDFYPDQSKSIFNVGLYSSIPTTHDDLDSMLSDIGVFADSLAKLPLTQTASQVNNMLASAEQTMQEATQLIQSLNQFAAQGKQLIEQPSAQELPQKLNTLITELEKTLQLFSNEKGLASSLDITLHEVQSTLRSIQKVADTIESKPDSLLFSSPRQADIVPGKDK